MPPRRASPPLTAAGGSSLKPAERGDDDCKKTRDRQHAPAGDRRGFGIDPERQDERGECRGDGEQSEDTIKAQTERVMRVAPPCTHHQPFGEAHQPDQEACKDGREDQRRPDLDGLAVVGADQQLGADARLRTGRQFTDDGADQARRHADLHRGEEVGHGDGRAQQPQRLRGCRTVGAHQVELEHFGAAQALHHAHRHREETEVGRDHRLGDELRRIAVQVQQVGDDIVPGQHIVDEDHHHWRHREDRHGLAGDDPRHQRAARGMVVDNEHRQQYAQRSAHGETQQGRRQCHPRMIEETALAPRFEQQCGIGEVDQHLVRRRQHRTRVAPALQHQIPPARRNAVAGQPVEDDR